MLTFKSILFVWGWNDVENARTIAKEADEYLKHLNYSLSQDLMYFYQNSYEEALDYEDPVTNSIMEGLIQSRNGSCDSLVKADSYYQVHDQLKILILLHIAECQFQTGRFDEATKSIKELQKVYNNIAASVTKYNRFHS